MQHHLWNEAAWAGWVLRGRGMQVNGALVSLNVIAYKSRASLDTARWGFDPL
jgi:hypothetical protein